MPDELISRLQTAAREFRPVESGTRVSVIAIANQHGIEVTLRAGADQRDRRASLIYSNPPEILIHRRAETKVSLRLALWDEPVLKTSERFSVAHEIGHWIAYTKFRVEPFIPGSHRNSEYWQHEKVFNEFAGCLLVPDWLVKSWLAERPSGSLITVANLNNWSRDINVSRITAATRLCQYRGGVGFLELLVQMDPRTSRIVLLVTESASGVDIKIPGRRKIIRNDRLVEKLKKRTATDLLRGLSFDGKNIGNYYVNWAQDGFRERKQDPRNSWLNQYIWTSWANEKVIYPSKDFLL